MDNGMTCEEDVKKEVKKEEVEERVEIEEEKEASEEKQEEKQEEQKEEIDYKEKFYYLAADMENLRKRHQKEKSNLIKFGMEGILTNLLGVMDNFERTVDAIKSDKDEKVKNIVVGIGMVQKQFMQILNDNGLTLVETEKKKFDPNLHEAVSTEKVEGKEKDEITKEMQKGYTLNGRLLRAAKVVVAE